MYDWLQYFCGDWEGWALENWFNYTSWITTVTATDRPKSVRPKSVRNRCVIEVFAGVFMLSRCFLDFSVSVGAFVIIGMSQISSFSLYVTCTDISVMWRHRCAGGLKKLFLRSGSQRHRHFVGLFNVSVKGPTWGPPLLRLFREIVPFNDTLGIRMTFSHIKPSGVPTGCMSYSTSNLNFDNSILFYLANFLFYSILYFLFCILIYLAVKFFIMFYSVFFSIMYSILFYLARFSILFYFVFYSVNYIMQNPKFCEYFFTSLIWPFIDLYVHYKINKSSYYIKIIFAI